MADTTLSQLRDDKNHINDINQILFENLSSATETKKQKKQKKLDFFENIVKNTIRSNVHFNRSNMFLVKNKFHKSTNYNRYRKTYVDKLRKYQRSKSLECRNDSKVLKLDDGKISFINSCCCFFFDHVICWSYVNYYKFYDTSSRKSKFNLYAISQICNTSKVYF